MKRVLLLVAVLWLVSFPAVAEQHGFQDSLLDQMTGSWVLNGTIAGAETTHDVVIEWVLGHQYLRFHEVARERGSDGMPAYEAIVFIGWDQPTGRYACLWLDVTGGGGLSADGIGYAEPGEDELAFVFDTGDQSIIHTTFVYDREADLWRWLIDNDREGKRTPFARVTLTRQ